MLHAERRHFEKTTWGERDEERHMEQSEREVRV